MEKTNFSLRKTIVTLKSLKFLTMSVVFTLLFMGVGFTSNAQVSSSAGAFDQSTFKNVDFAVDKNAAIQLIKTEYTSLVAQAPNLSGQSEAQNSLKLFFYEKVAVRLGSNQSIHEALAGGSNELSVYAANLNNGSSMVSGVVDGLVDLLD